MWGCSVDSKDVTYWNIPELGGRVTFFPTIFSGSTHVKLISFPEKSHGFPGRNGHQAAFFEPSGRIFVMANLEKWQRFSWMMVPKSFTFKKTCLFQQTSIKRWLFRVPGSYIFVEKLLDMGTHDEMQGSRSEEGCGNPTEGATARAGCRLFFGDLSPTWRIIPGLVSG